MTLPARDAAVAPRPAMPRAIWALGLVSLLMDISSEMVHALLPVFLATGLGASALVIGLIEGAGEATALVVKVFSGALSDHLGRRKPLALLGYGLGALSKPLFALAGAPAAVLTARLIDRVGKGLRGAPRDALVADIAPPAIRGAAFGLRQSLDTVGAFAGPLLAVGLMLWWAGDVRAVYAVAIVPGLLSVAVLWWGVQEPPQAPRATALNPIRRASLALLPPAYWWVVAMGAAFTLARFSEAFLVLRAMQGGLPAAYTPLVLVAMNLVYAGAAYPFGRLADRLPHRALLAAGIGVLVLADLALAAGSQWPWLALGTALWGLHMAMTQGLLATMVAQTAPAALRGTAFGLFNLASGIAMLLASAVAGALWQWWGATTTFLAGAGFSLLALALLWAVRAAGGPSHGAASGAVRSSSDAAS
jgi:MFS family permease